MDKHGTEMYKTTATIVMPDVQNSDIPKEAFSELYSIVTIGGCDLKMHRNSTHLHFSFYSTASKSSSLVLKQFAQ